MNKNNLIGDFIKAAIVISVSLALILSGSAAITNNENNNISPIFDTIYVDDDGGADYTKIQDAIDNASNGDTIFVYNGIYHEVLLINKEINLIGESKEDTLLSVNTSIIPSGGYPKHESLVNISSDNVVIESMTIQSTSDESYAVFLGVDILDSSNVRIENCIIQALWMPDLAVFEPAAIWINGETTTTSNIQIIDCEITAGGPFGGIYGIYIQGSINNEIRNCSIYDSGTNINIDGSSSGNIVQDSTLYMPMNLNSGNALRITGDENKIINNEMYNHEICIQLRGSYNDIIDNEFHDNYYGLLGLSGNTRNKIINNHFYNNSFRAISIGGTLNTYHHNEFINNGVNAYLPATATSNNYWDDGYEGNYWDDFTGNPGYPDEYQIAFGNTDDHPLTTWKPAPPQVNVNNPVGEELFGAEIPIEYEITNVIGEALNDAIISIDYNVNGGDWMEIDSGLPNTGEYLWEIPDNELEDHNKYLVRIGASYDGDTGYGVCDDEFAIDGTPPIVAINRPQPGDIFIFDTNPFGLPLPFAVVIGPITIIADAEDNFSGIGHVEFELGDATVDDTEAPYSWSFNGRIIGKRTLTVTAYDMVDRSATTSMDLFIINPFGS